MDMVIVEYWAGLELLQRQFGEIMRYQWAVFWSCLVLGTFFVAAPVFMFKSYKMLVYKPSYYIKYD
jgi:hypothetical protein